MRWVVLDFETASACDLEECGSWRYAEDPTTEIVCLGYHFNGADTVAAADHLVFDENSDPIDLLQELVADPEVIFIAHNVGFEKAIWRRIMVPLYGWPDIPNSRWHDTLAMCAMRVIPQDLESAARVLRLQQQKDKFGKRLIRELSKYRPIEIRVDEQGEEHIRYLKEGTAFSPQVLKRVYRYNGQDLRTQSTLHQALGWLPSSERSVWLLDQRINERGLRLDIPFIRAANWIVNTGTTKLHTEFKKITGYDVGQVAKITAWCKDEGAVVPDLQKDTIARLLGKDETGEDVASESEDDWCAELPPHVERMLEIRQLIGSASIKKLHRMAATVCADGRARGLLQYHGAGPGRWAGRLFQPHNFPRGTIKLGKVAPPPDMVVEAIMSEDAEYVEALFGPVVEVVVSSLRHGIIAEDDRGLVAGDFTGIEARVVLALAGQHDKTALLAAGHDVYLDMACSIYDVPAGTFNKEENPEERQDGKNSVLGLGFQMGARKFWLKYCNNRPFSFAERVVQTYRKDWAPKVPYVWYGLEEAAVRAVWDRRPYEAYGVEYQVEGAWLSARLPSGRKLWYYNPRAIRKAMPWDKTDIREGFAYEAKKLNVWRGHDTEAGPICAFGGLLTENVVQALARDIMVSAMFKCERENLPVVLTVHDEIVTEPLRQNVDKTLLAQIMADVPDWVKALRIPVKAETWAGNRYKK